ncbi:hypothetical protein TNCV_4515461 [Trichonephila clavipes]|nr:hypothetical protein TNCV_4515461 [Trichonephila clavipes]
MEHELAFTLHLAMYQEADFGVYITFMMNFRDILIRLKPSEVIELETICAMNIIDLMMEILPYHDPHDVPWFEMFFFFEPADLDSEFMEQEAAKGKGAFVQALWTRVCHPQVVLFGVKGLEMLWCSKLDHLDSFHTSSVGRVFWAEMARFRLPSTRLVFYLPQHDALAVKDVMRPFISLALPPPTPGCEQHLPPLQNTQPPDGPLDTVLIPRKIGE